ncbi:MAG: prepilin-type N-terminal cleavage/methylation domain-containing protein [Victivallales bacterium]
MRHNYPFRSSLQVFHGVCALRITSPSRATLLVDEVKTRVFTLVELLVVIAIISIIMAMLLPALKGAKEISQATACLNNQKQFGVACQMYAGDYNEYLPMQHDGDCYWRLKLSVYVFPETSGAMSNADPLLSKGVFLCPSYKMFEIPVSRQGGYGWNFRYMGNMLTADGRHMDDQGRTIRVSNVSKPSDTIVIGDGTDWYDLFWQPCILFCPSEPAANSAPTPTVGNRHSKGINLTWVDGHVSNMKQNDLRRGLNGDIDYFYRMKK